MKFRPVELIQRCFPMIGTMTRSVAAPWAGGWRARGRGGAARGSPVPRSHDCALAGARGEVGSGRRGGKGGSVISGKLLIRIWCKVE